jgi:hypothetical protein
MGSVVRQFRAVRSMSLCDRREHAERVMDVTCLRALFSLDAGTPLLASTPS